MKIYFRNVLIGCLLVASALANAQQKRVFTSIDTTKNKIGAQFNFTIRTAVDTLSNVTFPSGKKFGALEVIRNYVVDTIKTDNRYELIKRYGLAQFDSGRFTIPKLPVVINQKQFLTDSITVEVMSVKVDTLKQKMFDIKAVIEAPQSPSNWWFYLLLIVLLCALGFAAYRYWLTRKKNAPEVLVFKTPIEKATSLLQQLEQKELWQKGEVKHYYSELTDIARNYIEEAIQIPAMESTTSELIAALRAAAVRKNMSLSPETVENLERVLKQADLVKFAKSKPLDYEITSDKSKIEKAILTLDRSIPEEIQEETEAPEIAEAKLRKLKNVRQIKIASSAAVLLAMGILVFFVVTRGFTNVVDTILGNESKELLEGEWVSSTYGNPGITIETPEVLKRVDAAAFYPKQAMQLFKEFQMFGYGGLMDNFAISVATHTYQAEKQVDLKEALEGLVKIMELKGAQNMLVKQDEYETKEGITGIKAYGTFSILNPVQKESTKMYYELLLFGQENGLQQIIIMHEEGDVYAGQIAERMLNSVELKKVAP